MNEATRPNLRAAVASLVALTGGTEDEAVLIAVQERLARLTAPVSAAERAQHAITQLRGVCRRHAGPAPAPTDSDRALGYGSEGV